MELIAILQDGVPERPVQGVPAQAQEVLAGTEHVDTLVHPEDGTVWEWRRRGDPARR